MFKYIFTLLEEKMYTLGQVSIYFTVKKMYKLGQVSIYFAVSKDVPTEEKQIKLAK